MKRYKFARIDEDTHRKIKVKASQSGMTMNDYFKELAGDEPLELNNVTKKKKPFKFQI